MKVKCLINQQSSPVLLSKFFPVVSVGLNDSIVEKCLVNNGQVVSGLLAYVLSNHHHSKTLLLAGKVWYPTRVLRYGRTLWGFVFSAMHTT